MNNIVNLKDGLLTFNSNIDNSLTFSKCAIGYSNNDHVHERGSILFLTNNSEDNTSVNIDTDVKMSISSIGNIGIGGSLNTGENKLEVDGNINISSGNTYKINNCRTMSKLSSSLCWGVFVLLFLLCAGPFFISFPYY